MGCREAPEPPDNCTALVSLIPWLMGSQSRILEVDRVTEPKKQRTIPRCNDCNTYIWVSERVSNSGHKCRTDLRVGACEWCNQLGGGAGGLGWSNARHEGVVRGCRKPRRSTLLRDARRHCSTLHPSPSTVVTTVARNSNCSSLGAVHLVSVAHLRQDRVTAGSTRPMHAWAGLSCRSCRS